VSGLLCLTRQCLRSWQRGGALVLLRQFLVLVMALSRPLVTLVLILVLSVLSLLSHPLPFDCIHRFFIRFGGFVAQIVAHAPLPRRNSALGRNVIPCRAATRVLSHVRAAAEVMQVRHP
jgi:hypothetical protein